MRPGTDPWLRFYNVLMFGIQSIAIGLLTIWIAAPLGAFAHVVWRSLLYGWKLASALRWP